MLCSCRGVEEKNNFRLRSALEQSSPQHHEMRLTYDLARVRRVWRRIKSKHLSRFSHAASRVGGSAPPPPPSAAQASSSSEEQSSPRGAPEKKRKRAEPNEPCAEEATRRRAHAEHAAERTAAVELPLVAARDAPGEETKTCSSCSCSAASSAYSRTQWKKADAKRRCARCIGGGAPLPSLREVRVSAPALAVAATTPSASEASAVCCDKCDGPHETSTCPHFRKGRGAHPDEQRSASGRSIYDTGSTDAHFVLRNARVARQPGDGSCLFHSLAFTSRVGSARYVRQMIAKFIVRHPKLNIADSPLSDWIKWESGAGVKRYAAQMSRGGVWGGGIEMAVFSRLAKMNVHVYERMSSPRRRANGASRVAYGWMKGGGGGGWKRKHGSSGGGGGSGKGRKSKFGSRKNRKRERANSGDFGGTRVGEGSFSGGGGGGPAFRRIGCFDVPGARRTLHILYSGRVHYDALVVAQ